MLNANIDTAGPSGEAAVTLRGGVESRKRLVLHNDMRGVRAVAVLLLPAGGLVAQRKLQAVARRS